MIHLNQVITPERGTGLYAETPQAMHIAATDTINILFINAFLRFSVKFQYYFLSPIL